MGVYSVYCTHSTHCTWIEPGVVFRISAGDNFVCWTIVRIRRSTVRSVYCCRSRGLQCFKRLTDPLRETAET